MEITIEIDRLKLYAHHGVAEQERLVGNFFEVTVRLTYPAPYVINDSIHNTIDYSEITGIIKREMGIPSYLIEHVASRIQHSILNRFPAVTSGSVRVAKLTPPLGDPIAAAAATISW